MAVISALAAGVAAAPWARPAAGQQVLGGGHDGSLPIEITADSLEVFQRDQMAVFSGNVDAVQGELVLSADVLRVYYRGGEGGGEGGAAQTGAADAGAVRRIEAEGNVFLSSPEETAQGQSGVYDVEADHVTLTGGVVLTQAENVVRGEQLTLDLTTGRSRITGAVAGVADAPPEQRVRAVFVPGSGGSGGGSGGGN
ncbi:MAG TPA: LptA/OstA family protein [Geminicoccaceae bacterium]|nr:LptA/OstA family protein [Geminicoccaceae bacterium]